MAERNNLATILMSEEEFPSETDLQINVEQLTLVFYVFYNFIYVITNYHILKKFR